MVSVCIIVSWSQRSASVVRTRSMKFNFSVACCFIKSKKASLCNTGSIKLGIFVMPRLQSGRLLPSLALWARVALPRHFSLRMSWSLIRFHAVTLVAPKSWLSSSVSSISCSGM